MKKFKFQYEMIHDNLNNQWLLADLSNKNFKFFYKCDTSKTKKFINNFEIKKKKLLFF